MRIGIIGYYGFNNLGDELNLKCIMHILREQFKSVEFLVFSDCRKVEEKVDYSIVGVDYFPPDETSTRNVLNSCDLIVIGGGGLIYLGDYWFPIMDESITAPYIIYRVGIDDREVNPEAVNAHRKLFQHAREVTVRDHYSLELCRKYLTQNVRMVPEAIWNHPYKVTSYGFQSEKNIGINLRSFSPEIYPVLKIFFHGLRNQGYKLHFIPCQVMKQNQNLNDNKFHRIVAGNEDEIIPDDSSIEERCKLISKMDLCIGMRLHFVLLSLSQRVPVIALNYNNKVRNVMDEMFLNDYVVDLKNDSLLDSLENAFHRILRENDNIRSHVDQRVCIFEEDAKKFILT